MADQTVTRTQRRAAATRKAVVDAAREIIVSEGPAALTLEAVAERADVAVQTIYNRVGGRSALLTSVAELAMEENRAYMDAAYEAEGTSEERLLLAANAYVRFARERPHEFRILVDPPNDPETLDRIAALIEEQNAKLADVLRDAVAEGTTRTDLEPEQISTVLWATMNGLLALAWRADRLQTDADGLDGLLATYVGTITDGLRRRAEP
nr:TetR/AcrR family transcriptional regulator [Catenulispora rubra]